MTTKRKQRVTLFLNPKLLKQAKAQAIIEEMSLTSLTERALVRCLPKKTIIMKVEIETDLGPKKNRNSKS